jgi:16S rRNA (adenine1518-N6/adenine1519-N6)-dimethyltransferase
VALLSELVAVAFSQRRKMLRNTLGHWLNERCGDDVPVFDLQRRAEEVPVADYVALVTAVGLRDAAKKTAP